MTYQATGSARSPGGWTRACGRTAAVLLVGLVLLVRCVPVAHAADGLFCGMPLTRHLGTGATDSFNVSLAPGTVVSPDVVAADLGLLKLQSINFTPATAFCGELLLTVPQPPAGMDVPAGMINVSDCFGSTPHDYTITLSVVSQGANNCALSLPCGTPKSADFTISGEVDSYTFPGLVGEAVDLSSTPSGSIRLRLFDPSGAKIGDDGATCQGLHAQLPASGAYTVLASKCSGVGTGPYTVTWQPPNCAAKPPQGQFAYVTNADSGTLSVIDLSSSITKLTIPIAQPGQAAVGSSTYAAITRNGGFAWTTYGPSSSASVFNTSTNLLVASVSSGFDANGITISPDNATAYIVSNSLGGIVVVDTRTNKPTRVVQQDIGFSQGAAVGTTQDGTFLYTVSEDLGGLVKINTVDYTRADVTTLNLGLYDAFAVSPDGSFIYAGTLDGIVVIDTSTDMPTDTISTGEPFAIAFTQDGRTAYATMPDTGNVAVIDTATKRVFATIPNTGDSPAGVAIALDTGLAYVTDFTAGPADPGVFVIDTKSNQVIGSLPTLGGGPTGIGVTTAPTGLCVGDAQGETKVSIDELVLSVNYALNGCPGQFPSISVPVP